MCPDLATFRVLFPEFATVQDPAISAQLAGAMDELDAGAWGRCYNKAVMAYAAHTLMLSQARVASMQAAGAGLAMPPTGQVVSAGAEGLSVAFAAPAAGQSANATWLNQTPYGQQFLAYQRQCLSRGRLSW